ncbi:MAG: ABC transporter ATP-binding protein [Lachnospiraceae bacterium]|nr:ABC transporter ATP-binding protein [Lachnospiraceae bacterium]
MVDIKDLTKIYHEKKSNEFEALHHVDLTIKEGEMVGIVGTSGAGKSTLLHVLACIDSFEDGNYILDGCSVAGMKDKELAVIRNEKIGIVMQDFALVENFSATENVMIPLDFAKKKRSRKEKREMTMNVLEQMGLRDYAGKKVCQLSGGQKQRVAIARAIVNDPAVILADEPTGALDSMTTQEIMSVFQKLNEQGKTIIIVTHDKEVALQCGRIIEISDGKILEK